MPRGADGPTLIPTLRIIFHNIPYANLGCGAEPGCFGYPIAAVKEIARVRGLRADVLSSQLHG
jgi:hypothetical protein